MAAPGEVETSHGKTYGSILASWDELLANYSMTTNLFQPLSPAQELLPLETCALLQDKLSKKRLIFRTRTAYLSILIPSLVLFCVSFLDRKR